MLFRQRERALDFYAKMLQLDPDDALALASIGYQHAQLGRKRDALAMFDRVAQLRRATPRRTSTAASCCRSATITTARWRPFRALAINPDHDRALYGTALSLISTRRLEEAWGRSRRTRSCSR